MCTTLQLTAANSAVVAGRTMEFGIDVRSDLLVVPAGTPMRGTLANGAAGMAYNTRYGMAGATAFGLPILCDGINERGLHVGLLYFPGFAGYADIGPAEADRAMAAHEVGNWLLGCCATLDEVRAGADRLRLVAVPIADLGAPAPLHVMVRDRDGASLVIEPIDGQLVVHDNPVGVLTNAPPFDWHMTNLRNYIGLGARNLPARHLGGHPGAAGASARGGAMVEPLEMGNGTGLFGLPGDASPPSRFIRAVAYAQAALPARDAEAAVRLMFHIMNNFDIPPGSVRAEHGADELADVTAWTCVADLANLTWSFRTYDDQDIRRLDLAAALASCHGGSRRIEMGGRQGMRDVSAD